MNRLERDEREREREREYTYIGHRISRKGTNNNKKLQFYH